jgi:amino acid transporter
MFILGTNTVITFIPADQIDLIAPLPQVLRAGYAPFGIAAKLVTLAIILTFAVRLGQASVNFTGITRLPMVAGWDRLLPGWFTRLHATYRTPVNSILMVGVTAFIISTLGIIGVGQAEAFQLLFNAGGIFYAITYLVMFAIPLFGLRDLATPPPIWLKLASLSGLGMTLLYVVVGVFPIIRVQSVETFALKISLLIVFANIVGAFIFLSARTRKLTPPIAAGG